MVLAWSMLFISSYLIIDIFISLTARFNVGASLRTWMTLIGTYPIGVRQNTTINHNTVEFVVFMSQEKTFNLNLFKLPHWIFFCI